jgi:hypothetical protein
MEKIQELIKKPQNAGILGLIVGLIIGWFVIGWGIWPVEFTNADPTYLTDAYKSEYFCMAAQSFLKTGDAVQAKTRIESLREYGQDKLNVLLPPECGLTIGEIEQLKSALGAAQTEAPIPGEVEAPEDEASSPIGGNLVLVALSLCGATLLFGGVLFYIFFVRNRKKIGTSDRVSPAQQANMANQDAVPTDYSVEGHEPPIAQFMSTYVAGDDLYDDSFSIDSPSGEFLGECGVGISETIGVGEPKKVTAFEVWLFDKNDIQTVTKVLMSTHAFEDLAIAQRLASKGEPILLQPGSQVVLETATLQLEARVVDMNYGQGALPEGSFFDRLTLELAIWPKS